MGAPWRRLLNCSSTRGGSRGGGVQSGADLSMARVFIPLRREHYALYLQSVSAGEGASTPTSPAPPPASPSGPASSLSLRPPGRVERIENWNRAERTYRACGPCIRCCCYAVLPLPADYLILTGPSQVLSAVLPKVSPSTCRHKHRYCWVRRGPIAAAAGSRVPLGSRLGPWARPPGPGPSCPMQPPKAGISA